MRLAPWLKAARLPSQSYIFLPLLLGQTVALPVVKTLDMSVFVCVVMFGLAIQLYIVFANDYADQETDRSNLTFTPFSGGSRVLVDGDLEPEVVRKASLLMAFFSIAMGLVISILSHSLWPALLSLSGVALLWAYSYPPFELSYRGGGELLQMVGVGIVLPCMGYVAQTGKLETFPWPLLYVVLPTQLACAIGTAIPDEPSDRKSLKRTVAVLLGVPLARTMVILLHLTTVSLIALLPFGELGIEVHPTWSITAFIAIGGQCLFFSSAPGSRSIFIATFLSVLTTLVSMTALITAYWF
jgi:1,4-dihydroxy-2-naphthoate octaprenyltransferase